jgi:hypothetical protein
MITAGVIGLKQLWFSDEIPSSKANATPASSKPAATPFQSRREKIPPFTGNDNRTAPLLWSYRFSVAANDGCRGAEGEMWVEPNTVVFVKFVDGATGDVKVGVPGDRRTARNTSSWMAARFVLVGQMKYPTDIQISKREPFVVCDASENLFLHLEARRLP